MSPFTKVYQNQTQSGGGIRQTGGSNSQKQRSGKILTGSGMGRGLVGS